jgi:predicted phosphate transport protein (TIGR00153 family)
VTERDLASPGAGAAGSICYDCPFARGAMSAFSLVPRDKHFFKEFLNLAEEIRSGTRLLKQMLASDPPNMSKADEIKEIEHACDRCARSIIDRLNRTFVTPLDREDIHALAVSLDDVMDAIDAAAAVVRLYRIDHVRNGAKRLVEIVCDSIDRLAEALALLERRDGVLELAARVKQLEHEADRVHQDAIVELFDQERDPIAVIKWKEILDFLEAATDRCEDVADLLEGVIVKHA